MGTYRKQSTMEAFRNVYAKGGITTFWSGWQPKLVESFLKGGILLFSKDAVIRSMTSIGASEVTAGLVGGFAGGCAQVVVMGPCTFLVTAAVTGDKSVSLFQRSKDILRTRGIGGFYQGGTALLLRQGNLLFRKTPCTTCSLSIVLKFLLQVVTGRQDRVSLIS